MLEHGAISIFALPSSPQKAPTPPPPPLFGLSEFSSLFRSLFYPATQPRLPSSFLMGMPEFLIGDYYGAVAGAGAGQFISCETQKAGEQFTVDDLLNFSNEDEVMTDGNFFDNATGKSTDSSTVTSVGSCNASISGCGNHFGGGYVGSRSFTGSPFSGELCVPYDDLAELEWLSNFVEDSFSAQENDLQSMHFISTITGKAQTPETSSSSETLPSLSSETLKTGPFFNHESPLPGKARSKRARTAPCDWSTRLLHLLTPEEAKPPKAAASKRRESSNSECFGRKCLHCGSEKTPQWRTGPMGPKTLCNACGVRFKSGRLVPEYRPAASPTFVSAKHSNSHRKVLELRRQKEVQQAQEHPFLSQTSYFGVSNGSDDFLIHHHSGPDYSHLI